ncbi:alpha/beta fold hydrolase [Pendulispora albinea]|uniref:Alpha/beta hydrolase n=1 Tax=Pendulispora albinea TaxID=2741071 RepID=A0ABZ2M9G2_9BACT
MNASEHTFRHHKADVNGVRLHYVVAGRGDPVVLLHGFPQTWYEWRAIIPALAERFTVIAPDYRGAGHSSRPVDGYDKRTMAEDIRQLVRHLGFDRAAIVGHDIGLMVAYAYAAAYREATTKLVVMDAPLPGTNVWERIRVDPRVWHFAFHGTRDVPELLVAGKEREYLSLFYDARIYNPAAFTVADIDEFVRAYTAPGAMRAGFELYRAFPQDARDNQESMRTPLAMPVLAMGGAHSTSGPLIGEMMREVATDVTSVIVPESAHWLAEENPAHVIEHLLKFL